MNDSKKKPCLRCGGTLRAIGKDRSNGRDFLSGANNNKDWKKRQYHKKCWKEHQDDIEWKMRIKLQELERLKKENQQYKNLCLSLDIENPPPTIHENKEGENKKILNDDNKFIVTFQ